MEKISIHLGNLTFIIDKIALSKSLRVFQSNGSLKSSTSYRVKSITQRNVLRDFLLAARSHKIPKITPENKSQMIELSKEFDYHDLTLFLTKTDAKITKPANSIILNKQKINTNKTNIDEILKKKAMNNYQQRMNPQKDMKKNILSHKSETQKIPQKMENNEQIKSISEEKVLNKETTSANIENTDNSDQNNELSKTSSSLYDSSSYDYDYSSSSSYYEPYESDSDVDFDLSDDDLLKSKENEKSSEDKQKVKDDKIEVNKKRSKKTKSNIDSISNKEKVKKERTNKSEKSNIQKTRKIKAKKIILKTDLQIDNNQKIENDIKLEKIENSEIQLPNIQHIQQQQQQQKLEPLAESEPAIPSNQTSSSSEVMTSELLNAGLTPIQIMALNLQRALFGESSTEEPSSSSSLSLMQENTESDSSENVSFKNRIAQLEYVLFGLRPNDGIDHHSLKKTNNSSQELDRVNFTEIHSLTKRAPRHTNRHLPSILIKND